MKSSANIQIRRGTRIALMGTLASGLLQVSGLTVLSRFLTPSDYGTYAICLAFNAITIQFIASSVERAVLLLEQNAYARSSLAGVIIIMGLSSLLPVIGFLIADKLGYQGLSWPIMLVLITSQWINALAIVPRAMLRRNLEFGWIVIGEITGQFFGQFVSTIVFATLNFGGISLALGLLISNIISTSFVISKAPMIFSQWDASSIKRIFKLFRSVGIISGLEMLGGQTPPFLLGYIFGTSVVGLFNRANAIVGLPLQLITSSLSRVLLSGFSLISQDREALRESFFDHLRICSLICFPVAAGIAGSAQAFTEIILGKSWLTAQTMIFPVALYASAGLVCVITGTLADAAHRFRSKMRIQLLDNLLTILGIALFGQVSASAALYALAGTTILRLILSLGLSLSITHSSWSTVMSKMKPALFASLLVYFSATLAAEPIKDQSTLFIFVIQFLVCIAAFLLAIALTAPDLMEDGIRLLARKRKPKGSS